MMDKEIAQAPEEHLMRADEDAWVAAIVERHSVDPPQLHSEQWWQDPPIGTRGPLGPQATLHSFLFCGA